METEQINKFKREFKSLTYQQGQLTDSKERLKNLSRYDKNGSHQKALLKEMKNRDDIRAKIKEMEKGVAYDEWKKISKRLTALQYKLKVVDSRKRVIENELSTFKAP